MGRMRTESLFHETSRHKDVLEPVWSIKQAYAIYMDQPTEYDAAIALVGSIKHWRRLCKCSWFMDGTVRFEGLHQWREDKKAKDESALIKLLQTAAKGGDVPAANTLLRMSRDVAKKEKTTASVNRKKKEERSTGRQMNEFEKKRLERATKNTG